MRRGNDLAGAVHIVVIAVDLDQASVDLYAIDVVIERSVLCHNAILRRILRCRRIDHLTFGIKAIITLRNQAMRPGHVVSAVMHHFALGIDVVIIAVDFDQAYIRQLIVNIVAKRSILFNDSVLRCTDQFAILIKIVIAGLLQSMSPSDVVRAVPYNFTFGVHIVEITIDLDQSDIGRRSVDVVAEHPVGILHNTVLRRTDHLASASKQ